MWHWPLNPLRTSGTCHFVWWQTSQLVPLLTFSSPRIAARNLPWGTEDPPSAATAIAGAPQLRPSLTQHGWVVVVRRHLTARRLVGVAGGAALTKAVGLLSTRQLRTPSGRGRGGAREQKTEGWGWGVKGTTTHFFLRCFSFKDVLRCFSPQEVINDIRVRLQ